MSGPDRAASRTSGARTIQTSVGPPPSIPWAYHPKLEPRNPRWESLARNVERPEHREEPRATPHRTAALDRETRRSTAIAQRACVPPDRVTQPLATIPRELRTASAATARGSRRLHSPILLPLPQVLLGQYQPSEASLLP